MPARAWPIAREGFPFIVSGAAVAGFGWAVAAAPLAVVGSAWAVACAFFFRNPSRAVPAIIGG
ncbi:MAG: hypothetical protein HYV03_00895 [Deltaproteobacteria bacterium]|nr:hypothetical protein [Deltaproteobacteria bacterium]